MEGMRDETGEEGAAGAQQLALLEEAPQEGREGQRAAAMVVMVIAAPLMEAPEVLERELAAAAAAVIAFLILTREA